MAFNLDRSAREIHHEIHAEDLSIMAVFQLPDDIDEIDDFIVGIRTLAKRFEENEEGRIMGEMRTAANRVFTGWVNPEGREDLWVVNGAGEPVECTPENRAKFLSRHGVASAICNAFISALGDGEASTGNSKPSRGNGFASRVKDATPADQLTPR
jgi:hypothetical protein